MFVSRLLLPATLVLMPWFTNCGWGQNYSAMQAAYGGAFPTATRQFSLRNQATAPPSFPDQQDNEYTAMSPNSWGHPATHRNLPQTNYAAPTFATPNYANASPVFSEQAKSVRQDISAVENFVLDNSIEPLGSEQSSEIAPLTNTGDNRSDRNDQRAKFAGDRYAQAQDFPFDGPDSSTVKDARDTLFPFTRKEQADPVPLGEEQADALLGAQPTANPSDAAILPSDVVGSPTITDSQHVILPSTTDTELGLYPKPRSASPAMQSPLMQTQPYLGQQSYGQQTPVQPSSQWQYPNGETSLPPSGAVYQQGYQQVPSVSQQGFQQHVPNWTSMVQPQQSTPQAQSPQETLPNYRPDLGHRAAMPTIRNYTIEDNGKKFDHEKKKVDYPPFKEIIATGKFFYNAEVNALRPSFLGNTGLSVDSAEFSESQPFEFATTYAPLVKFGFESKYGPGVELSYFNLTENANTLGATNDGTGSVASIASVTGPGRFSRIGADNVGDTLTADHSFEMETIGLNFFKELKFPISRLNGKFGFMYANVAQSLLVEVNDAAGASVGELTNTTDFRGYGPQFALEYFRPVGHTPLTLVTSFGGKGLFGRRDQFLSNDAGIVERRFGADEFITVIDFAGGVQLKKMVADGRYWTAKVGYLHQSWLGGGTAVDPQGDFGISGFTFGIGYNR